MNSFFARLIPFIFLGIFIVLLAIGIILFSYLLIFGALVGFILFIITWLRDFFVRKKKPIAKSTRSGRTIDQK